MGFMVNELMVSHCKVLDDDAPYRYSLDSNCHRLTPTTISSIAASIKYDLIAILYYSTDATDDSIWTGDI